MAALHLSPKQNLQDMSNAKKSDASSDSGKFPCSPGTYYLVYFKGSDSNSNVVVALHYQCRN